MASTVACDLESKFVGPEHAAGVAVARSSQAAGCSVFPDHAVVCCDVKAARGCLADCRLVDLACRHNRLDSMLPGSSAHGQDWNWDGGWCSLSLVLIQVLELIVSDGREHRCQ